MNLLSDWILRCWHCNQKCNECELGAAGLMMGEVLHMSSKKCLLEDPVMIKKITKEKNIIFKNIKNIKNETYIDKIVYN